MHEITLISAVADNGVIGNDGALPWNYDEDLRYFRTQTLNSNVIMGRKTYESIINHLGHPLDDRHNIVLTSDPTYRNEDQLTFCQSIDAAIAEAEDTLYDKTFVIGGEHVYKQFLPYATRMLITQIPGEYDGDAFFPVWNSTDWEQTDCLENGELTFVTYERPFVTDQTDEN
jgi:dihydrofolate reductase